MDDRHLLTDRYNTATADLEPPLAVVDLTAFRQNAAGLARRAAGKPIRVASKSLRCRALLEHALRIDGFSGIMAFTLPEALWLAGCGVSDDILVAYPTADRYALAELAASPALARAITVTVDCPEHLDMIEKAVLGGTGRRPQPSASGDPGPEPVPVRVCIDIDAGYRALGGLARAGARRSPVRTPAQAAALARDITGRRSLHLAGLMAYEAQIAGVGDAPPRRPLYARAVRLMQARSQAELAQRRAAVAAAVREVAPLEFVNGGGTGSVEKTAAEDTVTEIAAGSGLYHPVLFDSYRNFRGQPAALFAVAVVRRPGPGVVTVLGGGYLASGPGGPSRLPVPWLPGGLRFDRDEGAGEVQTPLLGPAAAKLAVGDRVWMRHAKAGELCERFAELHLIEADRLVATVPTYRGEGKTFL
jgi:D-serine deaminase-like pyridoxal phosphate-dependent protein